MLDLRNQIASAREQRGFTLVEVTIILLVLVILSTIMLPQLGNFNRLARFVKVKEDLGAICATMKKFLDEVMVPGPFGKPGGGTAAPANPVGLLVGPGTVPTSAAGNQCTGASLNGNWDAVLSTGVANALFTCKTDIGTAVDVVNFVTDRLDYHLQVNQPFNTVSAVLTDRYKNQKDDASVGAFFGWRGPYFEEITADPWGTRYSVNTYGLHSASNGSTFSTAVICISFGPNLVADTAFELEHPNGYVIGGDDQAVVLSGMGPF